MFNSPALLRENLIGEFVKLGARITFASAFPEHPAQLMFIYSLYKLVIMSDIQNNSVAKLLLNLEHL